MKRISFLWLSPTLTAVGRRFGIDAHYFAKNSSLVLLSHVVSVLRGIITGYLVARLFEQETYGEYQFILSVVSMLALFTLPGLASSVTRAWARGDSFSLNRLTRRHVLICLAGSAVLLGAIPFLFYYGRGELWPLFAVSAVLFPLPPVAMVRYGGFTVGKARFDIALRATLIWSVLMIAATALILLYAQSALLMLMASMGIPSLVYLYISRRQQRPPEGPDNTPGILRYAWQLTFATLPVDAVWYVDKLMISHFLGLNQLATFAVALLIPEQAKILIKQFIPVAYAKQAAGGDTRERRTKLIKVVLTGMAVFACGIAVYIALAPFAIPLLFPNYDAREVVLLTSIAAATLIIQPGALFAQYLEAHGMIRAIRFSNWNAAASFAVALVALIPAYGLVGALLARGIFRFVYFGSTWWFMLRMPLAQKAPDVKTPRS